MTKNRISSERNTSFMKNVVMLMISQVLIKILGLVYKIVIVNIDGFGNIGNGYYSTGYQIYTMLLAISSIGIPNVISKLVSEKIAIGDSKGAHKIFITSLKLFAGLGLVLSLLLFFGADFVATDIIKAPGVKYTLKALSFAIVFVSASSVFRGYFSGLGSMKATSVSQTLEQIFNCTLSIAFVYACIGKDAAIMAAAGNLSTTFAVIISFSFLVRYYMIRKNEIKKECEEQTVSTDNRTNFNMVKAILLVSIPMTFGSLVSVINSTIDTVTISNCIQTAYSSVITDKEQLEDKAMELYGILQKADTLINLPLAISLTLCTALVPVVSSALAKKDYKAATRKISFSMFTSILIIFPCMAGFIALAEPIFKLLYPTVPQGAAVLQLDTIVMLFVALTYVINGALYGVGKMHIPAIALTLGAIVKFILNFVLITNPKINIYGSVISSILCQVISFLIGICAMRKYIKLDMNFTRHIFKPFISSVMMGVIVYFIHSVLTNNIGNTLATITSVCVGIFIYLILILAMNTLEKEDILSLPCGKKIFNLLYRIGMYRS